MACLEHACTNCSWSAFTNGPLLPGETRCPNCGGLVVTTAEKELGEEPERFLKAEDKND